MVYSPVPAPSSFGDPGSSQEPSLVFPERLETQFTPGMDAQAVLSYLRETIEAGTSSLDDSLNVISEAAQLLTGGTGAAVAMMRDGSVVCVGRSGETAPPLGARLSLDSGISGECLRTGTLLRCDDAFEDNLADPEVCRELGLRSIVALPLRGSAGVIGILEAFSSRPQAFSEEQIYFLGQLSELAKAAHEREPSSNTAVAPEPQSEESEPEPALSSPAISVAAAVAVENPPALAKRQRPVGVYIRQYWGMAAAIIALVVVIGSWILRPEPARQPARISSTPTRSAPPSSSLAAPAPSATVGAALSYKPSPARALPDNGSSGAVVRPAPPPSRAQATVVRRAVTDAEKAAYSTGSTEANQPAPEESTGNVISAPQMTRPMATSDVSELVSGTPSLPKLSPPVSQGTRGGTLDRKVVPIYPRQALETRIQGDVILEATVAENGQIQNLVVISGHPLLANAAVEAVSKWHYHPYLLNGEPVRKQTRITVTFKLPN
jgi:TonB family protein